MPNYFPFLWVAIATACLLACTLGRVRLPPCLCVPKCMCVLAYNPSRWGLNTSYPSTLHSHMHWTDREREVWGSREASQAKGGVCEKISVMADGVTGCDPRLVCPFSIGSLSQEERPALSCWGWIWAWLSSLHVSRIAHSHIKRQRVVFKQLPAGYPGFESSQGSLSSPSPSPGPLLPLSAFNYPVKGSKCQKHNLWNSLWAQEVKLVILHCNANTLQVISLFI